MAAAPRSGGPATPPTAFAVDRSPMSSDSREAGATSPMNETAPVAIAENDVPRTTKAAAATTTRPGPGDGTVAAAASRAKTPLPAMPATMRGLRPARSATAPRTTMATT